MITQILREDGRCSENDDKTIVIRGFQQIFNKILQKGLIASIPNLTNIW
jgi:hypothetical protein